MKVETKGNELIMNRVFDAPRELVFETFSDCKHLKHWWGPRSWPVSFCKMDFKVGGVWHFCLKGPNAGDESWGKALYKEIKKPSRIVYDDYFSDKDGNLNKSMPSTEITYDFTEQSGKTLVTGRAVYASAVDLEKVLAMGLVGGMTESLDRLEELLATVIK